MELNHKSIQIITNPISSGDLSSLDPTKLAWWSIVQVASTRIVITSKGSDGVSKRERRAKQVGSHPSSAIPGMALKWRPD